MKKSERQRHIQEIISNQYVERQEDLVKLDALLGYVLKLAVDFCHVWFNLIRLCARLGDRLCYRN